MSDLGCIATSSCTGAFGSMRRGARCGVGRIIKSYEMAVLSSLYLLKSIFKSNHKVNFPDFTQLLKLKC